MIIKDMFEKDINRPINGVIQVEQEQIDVIKQEVEEYVVTSELKKHFNEFFKYYSKSFDIPSDNTGVWITGFFGSGKSHFLKMLSYLLENKKINGKDTVEYFREKFDDELSFKNIEKATQVLTETILFNIDVEGSSEKDDTAVLKVFAKMFYEHLGFYGSDLKVAKLEQFISKQGKTDEFKAVFKEINGNSWISSRAESIFWGEDIITTLEKVLGMSKEAASHWIYNVDDIDISIAQLVNEIKEYVNTKPKDFRLLFMIDEAGQYVGTNTSLLLNLQSLIETLGSVCRGQVWVVATGQEALDDMIKIRSDEFSRIMARFSVRLSLTSSSVGEVIEKRLLTKKPESYDNLVMVYNNNSNVLDNLYSLNTSKKDLKGYRSSDEFARVFPFVPYQFIIMKDVFNEIRKKGHAGKHQSSGERSMLNGFQESAQKIQARNEFSLVPMYYFYDTLHSFLDTSIRSVIERAQKAADNNQGLNEFDVNLLKLLYLIRYIDDIPSTIENITILMADTIDTDKQILREKVKKSLDHLTNQNYVSRNGDVYMFLTDEEQDIARDINNTIIDESKIVNRLGEIIFNDIYKSRKFRYQNKYDFEFNALVDQKVFGNNRNNSMNLRFMTIASDPTYLEPFKLAMMSNKEVIIVLSEEYAYYESMQMALKIRSYSKKININQQPASIQKIIQDKQNEAKRLENQALEDVKQAIVDGTYYVDGENIKLSGSDCVIKINSALEQLVKNIYYNLNMIDSNYENDNEIKAVLKGNKQALEGLEKNQEACDEVMKYLDRQANMKWSTSMSDIKDKFSKIPYGWREIDIVGVIVQLLVMQKITIKANGENLVPSYYLLLDHLRNKNKIGYAIIAKRERINNLNINQTRKFLREYFDVQSIPSDEDGLIEYIIRRFNDIKGELEEYKKKNYPRQYPGYDKIIEGLRLIDELLSKQSDSIALIDKLLELQDDLLDNSDDMKKVEQFYDSQFELFKTADDRIRQTEREKDCFASNQEVLDALSKMKEIVRYVDNYNYGRIPNLNGLISIINDARLALLKAKKQELLDLINQCFDELTIKSQTDTKKLANILNQARVNFNRRIQEIKEIKSLIDLDAKKQVIINDTTSYLALMDSALKPNVVKAKPVVDSVNKKKVKECYRQVIFPAKTLKNQEDVDDYLNELKHRLMKYLDENDEIRLK